MISDRELWACANHFVPKHGDESPVIAAMHCDELQDECDYEGARTFPAIIVRINRLLGGGYGPLH